MDQISDLTYQVVAFSEVPNFNTDVCVDWAFEMISLGHDTPSLLMLAGLNRPTNYFHTVEYLKAALNELQLEVKDGDKAIISYCFYFIKRIANGENVKTNLNEVYKFCKGKDYAKSIYDFYLLYWAWDDLDYGNEVQFYWAGANKDNIEQNVISVATQWLKENDKYYSQQVYRRPN